MAERWGSSLGSGTNELRKGDVMFSFLLTNLDADGRCTGADQRRARGYAKGTGNRQWVRCGLAAFAAMFAANAHSETCPQLAALGLTDANLKSALRAVVPASGTPNGGLGFPMWLTLVDGSGIVCSVINSLDGSANNADAFAGVPAFGSFDKMFQDITDNPNGGTGISASGFGHPKCLFNPTQAQAGGSIIGN